MPLLAAAVPALIGAGVGAAGGAAKTAMEGDKAARERKLAAATQAYSPWTGLQAEKVQEADPFGNILGGVSAGGAMGQQFGKAPTPLIVPQGASVVNPVTGKPYSG